MTDEVGGEAAAVDTTAQAAVEAAVSSQDTETQEPDYEAKALKWGWSPKENWKGDPDNWKDAKTYVQDGENIARVARGELHKEREEFQKRIDRLEKAQERTVERLKKAHQQELAELTGQRREAIKKGDVDAVETLDAAISELKEEGPAKPSTDGETEQEVEAAWVARNEWYTTDPRMHRLANDYSQMIKRPDLSMKDNLAKVDAYMRREFPEKFEEKKPAANGHAAAVDAGGDFSGPVPRKETLFSKLPTEAKRQFERDLKDPKLALKDSAADREQWAKDYNS